jgi:hypothetical protein
MHQLIFQQACGAAGFAAGGHAVGQQAAFAGQQAAFMQAAAAAQLGGLLPAATAQLSGLLSGWASAGATAGAPPPQLLRQQRSCSPSRGKAPAPPSAAGRSSAPMSMDATDFGGAPAKGRSAGKPSGTGSWAASTGAGRGGCAGHRNARWRGARSRHVPGPNLHHTWPATGAWPAHGRQSKVAALPATAAKRSSSGGARPSGGSRKKQRPMQSDDM